MEMTTYAAELKEKKQLFAKRGEKKRALSQEDVMILSTLEKLQADLERIHRSLDAVSDPDLIDSFVYELNAVNMRYKFYLQMCKDKGLVAAIF